MAKPSRFELPLCRRTWVKSRSDSVKYAPRSSGGTSEGKRLRRSRSVSVRKLPGIRFPVRLLPLLCGEVTVERAPADPERPADVVDGVRLVIVQGERLGPLLVVELGPTPAPLTACPCRVEPGPGPFADEVPLELGQGGEDVEDELAAAGG